MEILISQRARKLVERNYKFLDHFYKSQSVEKGNAIKKFIKDLCQNTFLLNCEMLCGYGNFPFSDESENGSYASISTALYTQTPFVMSEVNLNFTESNRKDVAQKGGNRSVDFWCARNSANRLTDFELWFEVKKLGEYNITGSKLKDRFKSRDEETILRVLRQISDVREHRPAASKKNAKSYAVALLNIPVRYAKNSQIEYSVLEKTPKKVLEIVEKIVRKFDSSLHILCGYMDFGCEVARAAHKGECFLELDGRVTHFAMMCAVVMECE